MDEDYLDRLLKSVEDKEAELDLDPVPEIPAATQDFVVPNDIAPEDLVPSPEPELIIEPEPIIEPETIIEPEPASESASIPEPETVTESVQKPISVEAEPMQEIRADVPSAEPTISDEERRLEELLSGKTGEPEPISENASDYSAQETAEPEPEAEQIQEAGIEPEPEPIQEAGIEPEPVQVEEAPAMEMPEGMEPEEPFDVMAAMNEVDLSEDIPEGMEPEEPFDVMAAMNEVDLSEDISDESGEETSLEDIFAEAEQLQHELETEIEAMEEEAASAEEAIPEPEAAEPVDEALVEPAEETIAESEHAADTVDDDPNKQLSADDIAALFAAADTPSEEVSVSDEMDFGEETSPIEEESVSEEVPISGEAPSSEEVSAIEDITTSEDVPVSEGADASEEVSGDDVSMDDILVEAETLVGDEESGEPGIKYTLADDAEMPGDELVEEAEAPAEAEPDDDPNKQLSADEIAALFEGADSAPAGDAEPEPAEAPVEVEPDDDPNKQLSADEIAALFEGADSAPAGDAEPEPAEELVEGESEGASEDELSMDDILAEAEALSGDEGEEAPQEPIEDTSSEPTDENTEAPVEEPAPAEEPIPAEDPAPSADDDPNHVMSADEIDALFAAAEGAAMEEDAESGPAEEPEEEASMDSALEDALGLLGEDAAAEDSDVTELIDEMGDDADLSEVGDLLKKDDNLDLVDDDLMSMLTGEGEEDGEDGGESPEEDDESGKGRKKRRKKKKKKNAEPETDEEGNPIEKKSFIQKLQAFLFASDEDEEEGADLEGAASNVANPSEQTLENAALLGEDIQAEEGGKKKKKKEKKKKEKPKKEKKPKEKKPKKPKKEKPPVEEIPQKKLPKKKVAAVALFFASFLAAVTFCTFAFANVGYESAAKTNYDKGDYEGAFDSLVGLTHLSDESRDIYNKSFVLMRLQRKIDAYNEFQQREMPLEAIDSLMQGVVIHDALTEYAASLGVGDGFEALYQEILGYLSGMYGVSEDAARETSRISDDLEYTMALLDIVDPTWRDEIEPTVELTEGGAAMPEYTGEPPAEEEPPHEEEAEPVNNDDEGMDNDQEGDTAPDDMNDSGDEGNNGGEPDDQGGEPSGDNGDGGNGGGFTLTPDSDTDITNSDGTHIEISNPETNTGGDTGGYNPAPSGGSDPGDQNTASDGTTLYSFNVKKGADGRYHQTN